MAAVGGGTSAQGKPVSDEWSPEPAYTSTNRADGTYSVPLLRADVPDVSVARVPAAENDEGSCVGGGEVAHGTVPFGSVPVGKQESRSVPTGAASVPASEVTVAASATVDGESVSASRRAQYSAGSCG
jgi:hypothetical protein